MHGKERRRLLPTECRLAKALVAVCCLTFNGRLVQLWSLQLLPVSVRVVFWLKLWTPSPLKTPIRPAATKEPTDDASNWSFPTSICKKLPLTAFTTRPHPSCQGRLVAKFFLLFFLLLLLRCYYWLVTDVWVLPYRVIVGQPQEALAGLLKSRKCKATLITFIILSPPSAHRPPRGRRYANALI